MKKLLSLLLVMAMTLSLFAGCASDTEDKPADKGAQSTEKAGEEATEAAPETPKETVKLQMSVFGSENDEAVYQERLKLAKEVYPHIEVELLYVPADYSTKLKTMIVGGSAPDIMQLSEDVHAYSALGQIMPLNSLVEGAGLDLAGRFGSAHETYSHDGNLYAMPDRGGAMIVYYNKDMFDAAGVGYPTKAWTWDDMLDAAQKLTVRNGDDVEVYGFAAGDWWPWWMSFIYQNDGRILDENNNVVVNSPETVEALEFYNDLVYKHKVAPSPEDYGNMGNPGPDPLFAQGKVAFEITGFWNIGSLNKVEGLNWDIAPLWGQASNATTAFGSGLALSSTTEHPEEAYKVIEFLTSEEGQMPIVDMKQDAPANVAVLQSEAFLNADFAKNPINMSTFAESADMIMNLPLGPHWNELTQVCNENLSQLFTNQKDAATVAAEMQADLEQMMSRYK